MEHPLPPGLHVISREMLWVNPDHLRQTKPGADADASLVANIKAIGLIQPLTVRWRDDCGEVMHDGYEVLAGRRRLVACIAADMAEIPCFVRIADTAGEATAIELSENIIRADMAPIDVFAAVERLASEGMDDPAICIALNLTERRVAQMRAMGRMHPDIVAHMRETGSFPRDGEVRIICQAPLALQGEAFAAAKKRAGKVPVDWYAVATACQITRIPMQYARFDRALYKGTTFRDLFAGVDEDAPEEADSPSLFMKLQQAWLDEEIKRRSQEGFEASVGELNPYGSLKKPKGSTDNWKSLDAKLPARKDRPKWQYVAAIGADGRVHERLYEIKQKPAASPAEAGAPADTAKPANDGKLLVTQKGIELIEQAKRDAAAEAARELGFDEDQRRVVALAHLLSARLGYWSDENPQLPLREDGTPDMLADSDWRLFADAVIAAGVRNASITMGYVETVGALLEGMPRLPAEEIVDHMKAPALHKALAVATAGGQGVGSGLKQGEMRKVLRTRAPSIGPEHLPMLAWAPPRPEHPAIVHDEPGGSEEDEPGEMEEAA